MTSNFPYKFQHFFDINKNFDEISQFCYFFLSVKICKNSLTSKLILMFDVDLTSQFQHFLLDVKKTLKINMPAGLWLEPGEYHVSQSQIQPNLFSTHTNSYTVKYAIELI